MNKKNLIKIILDICMVTVLVLMYNKMAINLTFHEIGGLILLGMILIHMLINWKWVITITKKIFNKSISIRTKIGYILNVLLLISFLLIGISGIFISKIVFSISSNGGMLWKMVHYTSSAIALILIGIHLGLHKNFICNMLKKILPIPEKVRKIVGIFLTIVIFSYGCYSLISSNFYSWLVMPFTIQQISGDFEKGTTPEFEGKRPEKTGEAKENSSKEIPSMEDADLTKNPQISEGRRESEDGKDFPRGDEGFQEDRKGGIGHSAGISNTIKTFIDYFSITFVFAVIVSIVDKFIKLKKKERIII